MPLTKLKIRWSYLIAFLLLLISYTLIFLIIRKLASETDSITHSYDVVSNLESIKSEIIDAETGVRGYVLTKDSGFLKPYLTGSVKVMPLFDSLTVRTADNPQYAPKLVLLGDLLRARLNYLAWAIDDFKKNGFNVSEEMIAHRGENKRRTDSIRLLIGQMQINEQSLRGERDAKLRGFFSSTWIITVSSLVIALVTILYSVMIYNRENRARENADRDSRLYSLQLEQRVNELDRVNRELEELKSLEKFTATGRIARTIAHEVRNPLTNISLASEQLKEITGGHAEAELLHDMISRNATRINQLVSDLLNSTRFAQLEYSDTTINEIVDETLEMAADRIELNQVKVVKVYEKTPCEIRIDKEKIKLAFLNIVVNAIEAMEKGEGVLEVRTRRQDSRCVVEFKDNGTGIDEETIRKLYEPYFTKKAKGNGLGLTNSQNIILNHKGTISVRSKVGMGTTFIISLSLQQEQESDAGGKV